MITPNPCHMQIHTIADENYALVADLTCCKCGHLLYIPLKENNDEE